MARQLMSSAKIVRVMNGAAAGTTDVLTSSAIDTSGYSSVTIVAAVGTLTSGAVTTLKLQQSSDDAGADDYSDILGSSQAWADDDDNQQIIAEVHRPGKRYIKALITRATANAVVDGIWAILYNANQTPSADTSTASTEVHVTPAEGTA